MLYLLNVITHCYRLFNMSTKIYLNNTFTINKTNGRMRHSYLYETFELFFFLKDHKQKCPIVKTERESV